jgi:hypothetical protein
MVVGRAFSKRTCHISSSSNLHTSSAYILWPHPLRAVLHVITSDKGHYDSLDF